MRLGDFIKKYRRVHGVSMQAFADKAGLSKGYISMLENGKNPQNGYPISPTLGTLKKIADGMGITVQELTENIDEDVELSEGNPSNGVSHGLSDHELLLISAYRSHPAMQPAVDKLLGIESFVSEKEA